MIATFHNVAASGAIHLQRAPVRLFHRSPRLCDPLPFSTVFHSLCMFLWIMIRVASWLLIEFAAKWSLMGRRKVGRYNYDKSSYAQRWEWEIYQLIGKVRKVNRLNLLEFLSEHHSWHLFPFERR
jgi:hypothetical protein